MQFTLSVSALAAFAATVLAQTADFNPVFNPEKNQEIPAGEAYEITWEAPAKYADGTISIQLIGGKDQDHQEPIAEIAAGIPNSAEKYSWSVDASLGDAAVYGLVFKYEPDTAVFQYSNPFHIVKAEGEGADAPEGSQTTTISKSYGTKTVTLESCDCEETTTATPPAATSTPVYTTTPAVNSTTSYITPTTIETKPAPTTIVTDIETVPETTAPATVPEEGAAFRFGASPVALVAAFVVAAFAL